MKHSQNFAQKTLPYLWYVVQFMFLFSSIFIIYIPWLLTLRLALNSRNVRKRRSQYQSNCDHYLATRGGPYLTPGVWNGTKNLLEFMSIISTLWSVLGSRWVYQGKGFYKVAALTISTVTLLSTKYLSSHLPFWWTLQICPKRLL